jgi:hypothetical protein
MPPLALCDSEITAVMAACRQLQPRQRQDFLRHVAALLGGMPVRGDGAVHRAISAVWREYFDPPLDVPAD